MVGVAYTCTPCLLESKYALWSTVQRENNKLTNNMDSAAATNQLPIDSSLNKYHFIMLDTPGDLIPVVSAASSIPWTRRRSQILNFLHRGPVSFSTLVYDTNVGDISPLSSYFNPQRISEKDLNSKFGQYPTNGGVHPDDVKRIGTEAVVMPRLLLYPLHPLSMPVQHQQPEQGGLVVGNDQGKLDIDAARELEEPELFPALDQNQVKVQRTLNWVLSQDKEVPSPQTLDSVICTTPVEELVRVDSSPNPLKELEGPLDLDPLLLDLDCLSLGQQLTASWPDSFEASFPRPRTMPSRVLSSALADVRSGLDKWDSWETGITW